MTREREQSKGGRQCVTLRYRYLFLFHPNLRGYPNTRDDEAHLTGPRHPQTIHCSTEEAYIPCLNSEPRGRGTPQRIAQWSRLHPAQQPWPHLQEENVSTGSHMIQELTTYSDLAAQPPGRLSGDPLRTSRMHAHGRNCSSPHPRRPWSELCTMSVSCSQKNSGVPRVIRCLPFIPHLPVTGVKNSGISSCSTFFLSDAITKTRSMTLSG